MKQKTPNAFNSASKGCIKVWEPSIGWLSHDRGVNFASNQKISPEWKGNEDMTLALDGFPSNQIHQMHSIVYFKDLSKYGSDSYTGCPMRCGKDSLKFKDFAHRREMTIRYQSWKCLYNSPCGGDPLEAKQRQASIYPSTECIIVLGPYLY